MTPISNQTENILTTIKDCLEDSKAENIVVIPINNRSSIADYFVIACGSSGRHISSLADKLEITIKEKYNFSPKIDGQHNCDWVLVDAGDIIIHLFRPEIRELYNLEKLWQQQPSTTTTTQ